MTEERKKLDYRHFFGGLIIGIILYKVLFWGISGLYPPEKHWAEENQKTMEEKKEEKTYPKYVGTTDDIAWEDKTERERRLDMTVNIDELEDTKKCTLLAGYRYENFSHEPLQKHKPPYLWDEEKQACLDRENNPINLQEFRKEITIQRKREL